MVLECSIIRKLQCRFLHFCLILHWLLFAKPLKAGNAQIKDISLVKVENLVKIFKLNNPEPQAKA